jgi:hypothetical protein
VRAARAVFRPVLRATRAVFRPVLRAARAVLRPVLRAVLLAFRAVLRTVLRAFRAVFVAIVFLPFRFDGCVFIELLRQTLPSHMASQATTAQAV